MSEIVIIADDLTGAADTGVQFLAGGSVKLVNIDRFSGAASKAWGLAIDTETRNLNEESVPSVIKKASEIIKDVNPALIYKKMDSCLRGHPGLELATLVLELGMDGALVAPAYPAFKRFTRQNLHYVGEVLVSESESAKDPRKPVLDSRLTVIMAQGHALPVCHIGLAAIRNGAQAVVALLNDFLGKGQAIIASDAETDEDLAILIEAALTTNKKLIFSGSAGLGQALAGKIALSAAQPELSALPSRPTLFFCGSASLKLLDQVNYLVDTEKISLLTLDPEDLLNQVGNNDVKAELQISSGQLPLVLNISQPKDSGSQISSQKLIGNFGRLAARLAGDLKPRTMFLSGGDTAMAVLSALDTSEAWLRREVEPGVVFLETEKLNLLTKSGGFGDKELLARLYCNLPH